MNRIPFAAVALLLVTAAGPSHAEPPAEEPGMLRVRVDASGAADALARFKIRTGHLVVRIDGVDEVDRAEKKVPDDELVYADLLAPGEHVVEVRWEVAFRSATDRHHPEPLRPDELGFAVPGEGFGRCPVTLAPGDEITLTLRLMRKASGGLQGPTWVECDAGETG